MRSWRPSEPQTRLALLVVAIVTIVAAIAGVWAAWISGPHTPAWAPSEGPAQVWDDGATVHLAPPPTGDSFGIWIDCQSTWVCSSSGETYHLALWNLAISASTTSDAASQITVDFVFGCPGDNTTCSGGHSQSTLEYNFSSGTHGASVAETYQVEAYQITVSNTGPSAVTVVWSASAIFDYQGF